MSGQKVRDGASWYRAPRARKTAEVLEELAGASAPQESKEQQGKTAKTLSPEHQAAIRGAQEAWARGKAEAESMLEGLTPGDVLSDGRTPPEERVGSTAGSKSPPEGRPLEQERPKGVEAVNRAPQERAASDDASDVGSTAMTPPVERTERRVGHGGKHPETNMEIAVIARRRVRGMIQVLNDIAREKKNPCSARVSAAKAIIDFARLKQDDVKDLTDHEIRELAKQIVEGRASSAKEGRALSRAAGLGAKKSSKASAKGPTKH